jgi:DNA-binding FadR family transcriptional regulator
LDFEAQSAPRIIKIQHKSSDKSSISWGILPYKPKRSYCRSESKSPAGLERMAQDPGAQGAHPPRKSLADRITMSLRLQLASGKLKPGDRLPTEKELTHEHGVSRAVVREAIAALRSEGLILARQGSGIFVAQHSLESLRQNLFQFESGKLSSIIEILELRAAVESEAAALSAIRCSPAELAKIKECHQAVGDMINAGGRAEAEDFSLHLAIVESTHNRHFVDFFRFLGAKTIPRAQAKSQQGETESKESFLQLIHHEHALIVDAIADRDLARARSAMWAHLKGSQKRYERLANDDVTKG